MNQRLSPRLDVQVFGGDANPSSMYEDVLAPLVEHVWEGRSSVLVSYGPSRAGKTWLVRGPSTPPSTPVVPGAGLLHCAVEDFLRRVQAERASSLRLAVMGLFGEELFDLLVPQAPQGRSAGSRLDVLPPVRGRSKFHLRLSQQTITTLDDLGIVLPVVRENAASALPPFRVDPVKRGLGGPEDTPRDSGMHVFFFLTVHAPSSTREAPAPSAETRATTPRTATPRRAEPTTPTAALSPSAKTVSSPLLPSQLIIADLCGSDSLVLNETLHPVTIQALRRRRASVHQSLLAFTRLLADVVRSGADSLPPAAFRASFLTRLLQPALIGASRLHVLGCLSQSARCQDETLNAVRVLGLFRDLRRADLRTVSPRGPIRGDSAHFVPVLESPSPPSRVSRDVPSTDEALRSETRTGRAATATADAQDERTLARKVMEIGVDLDWMAETRFQDFADTLHRLAETGSAAPSSSWSELERSVLDSPTRVGETALALDPRDAALRVAVLAVAETRRTLRSVSQRLRSLVPEEEEVSLRFDDRALQDAIEEILGDGTFGDFEISSGIIPGSPVHGDVKAAGGGGGGGTSARTV